MLCSPTADYAGVIEGLQGKVKVTNNRDQLTRQLEQLLRTKGQVLRFEDWKFQIERSSSWIVPTGKLGDIGIACLLLSKNGSTYKVEQLLASEEFMPTSAVIVGNQMLIGGQGAFPSNASHAEVRLYNKTPEGWRLQSSADTQFEMYPFTSAKSHGRWGAEVFGRTYPKNIEVSHAAANIEMSRRFTLINGKLVAGPEKSISCPQATLDKAIGAALKKRTKDLRALCTTTDLARRMQILAPRLIKSGWDRDDASRVWTAITVGREFNFRKRSGRWLISEIRMIKPRDW